MSDKVAAFTDSTWDSEVLGSDTPVVVDFWAEWCAPCLALAPMIDQLAEDFPEKLTVAKVDIDSNPGIPTKFGIRGIPTVILFKDGEQLDIFVGNSPQKVREMVERAV